MIGKLTEAFQTLDLIEEEAFDITNDGIAELDAFKKNDTSSDFEDIIDPFADDEEELQDSYVGKVILDCSVCQSKLYKDPEEVTISENGELVNVGETCPYCQSNDGFKVVGQVAEYCSECAAKEAEKDADADFDKSGDVSAEEADAALAVSEDDLDEGVKAGKGVTSKKGLTNMEKIQRTFKEAFGDSEEVSVKTDAEYEIRYTFDARGSLAKEAYKFRAPMDEAAIYVAGSLASDFAYDLADEFGPEFENVTSPDELTSEMWAKVVKALPSDVVNVVKDRLDSSEEVLKVQIRKDRQKIFAWDLQDEGDFFESLEEVSVKTDAETIKVTSEPNGEVVATKGDEVITPVDDSTEAKFKKDGEDEYADIDINEFDENEFDELGEKYLKRVYENVKSYKTEKGYIKDNKIKLEGLITFKSGKTSKTSFVFEAKTATKTGKLKFIGENAQLARNKNAFTLTGRANKGKLIAESLTYNYRAKDAATNKSQKLYGRVVKRSK